MSWLDVAACGGEDQADGITPPRGVERWNRKDEAVVTAALTRCAGCPSRDPCLTEGLEDKRDGASGGIYTYHGNKGVVRRWVLRAGKLRQLPNDTAA